MLSSASGGSKAHGLHELDGPPVTELWAVDELEAVVRRLGGEQLQEPGLQVHVGEVQVLYSTQHPTYLPDDLLRESWEDQVKTQPGIDHVMPVEGGLHQCEPGEGILGPEWWQFHLGWCYVLVCRR